MERHYRHFNARETLDAARAYSDHVERGGKMMVTLAGAMSTAELGISLARMIREGKVHAISCTAANMEEDLFNLVAHDEYRVIPNYRDLTPQDEDQLRKDGFNRVTDTCIPETVMRHMDREFVDLWMRAEQRGESHFPWEYCFELLRSGRIERHYQIDPANSWMVAAAEADLPVYSPGFEDSTIGNGFAAEIMLGESISDHRVIRSGTEQMEHLARWYLKHSGGVGVGLFQIGGGIAGDFPICVVPMLIQDMRLTDTPFWSYFAQIGDSTTSYGSYSGAVPNEKITWWKLGPDTPRFMINSDASIVAPLIFSYVLGD
jgi:deoxyhypusine synthase